MSLPLVLNIPTYMMLPQYLHMMQEAMVAAQNHLPPPQPPQNPLATIGNGAATIISLWAFVELAIASRRHERADNRYGTDPLAGRGGLGRRQWHSGNRFGFGGRINRAKIWAFLIVALVFEIVIVIAVQMTLGFGNILNIVQGKAAWASLGGRLPLFYAVCGVLYLLLSYMQMAVMTKRLHDRNKSAWWLLVFVVLPAALSFAGIGQAMYTLQHFHEIMAAAQSGHPCRSRPRRSAPSRAAHPRCCIFGCSSNSTACAARSVTTAMAPTRWRAAASRGVHRARRPGSPDRRPGPARWARTRPSGPYQTRPG